MPSALLVPASSLAAIQDKDTNVISTILRETPTPTSTQVLVKIDYAGVCATDIHIARQDIPYLRPTVSIGGHEGIGTIAVLGPDVDSNIWHVGDRVGVYWLYSVCKDCELCTTGYENLCPDRKLSGKDVEGSFAQYTIAASARLIRIPEGVTGAEAAPILCAGVTVYKALKVADLAPGAWVTIAGAGGGLGHMAIQYARAMGLRSIALDIGKRDICTRLGASTYIDALESQDIPAEILKITDGGSHCALICASSGQAYANAVKYLRRAGKLVCIGLPPKPTPIPVLPEDFIARGIKILGTSTGNVKDTEEALDYLARGQVKPQVIERKLEDIERILEDIEGGRVEGRIVIKIVQ
jgi:propanol-preferring alcohol dehydrogenase